MVETTAFLDAAALHVGNKVPVELIVDRAHAEEQGDLQPFYKGRKQLYKEVHSLFKPGILDVIEGSIVL